MALWYKKKDDTWFLMEDDHILRPIVFIVNEFGEIEDIPRHRDFVHMAITPLANICETVWVDEKGRLSVREALRKCIEEDPLWR